MYKINLIKIRLILWKEELLNSKQTFVKEVNSEVVDSILNEDDSIIFLIQENKREKLINEINFMIERIKNNTYGICQISEEPIDIERLIANPLARYSFEIQKLIDSSQIK